MQVLLPKLGFTMEKGTVAEWLVPDGAQVTSGQPLYSLESDKSVEEIPAPVSGRLRIIEPAGGEYAVGTPLADIDESAAG